MKKNFDDDNDQFFGAFAVKNHAKEIEDAAVRDGVKGNKTSYDWAYKVDPKLKKRVEERIAAEKAKKSK